MSVLIHDTLPSIPQYFCDFRYPLSLICPQSCRNIRASSLYTLVKARKTYSGTLPYNPIYLIFLASAWLPPNTMRFGGLVLPLYWLQPSTQEERDVYPEFLFHPAVTTSPRLLPVNMQVCLIPTTSWPCPCPLRAWFAKVKSDLASKV